MPECRHCAGLKKQSLWKYEIRTRNLPSTSQDRYRYVILLCSISKHKMEFTVVCWTLIDTLFTNLSAGYHCGRTAPCTGPLYYLTIVVCHFRPLLCRACVRSDERDTLIFSRLWLNSPLVGQDLLIVEASRPNSDTTHPVGLLWSNNRAALIRLKKN